MLPEVCLGACSQLPHSGIWTLLYNLPKEEASAVPTHGSQSLGKPTLGRRLQQTEFSSPRSFPDIVGEHQEAHLPCQTPVYA